MNLCWNRLTECYSFDTGLLQGEIDPYHNYHGIRGLTHCNERFNVVRPGKSFLNMEYYLRPSTPQKMLPRDLSRQQRTSHEIVDDSVVIRFPPEAAYGLDITLGYRPHGDAVDLTLTALPTKDVPACDVFFASYVCECFDETWACLQPPTAGPLWTRLENREEMNHVVKVARDSESAKRTEDGRHSSGREITHRRQMLGEWFAKSAIVARNSQTGYALILLLDPERTHCLCTQFHGWDTAHDWAWDVGAVAGQEVELKARLVYRRIDDDMSDGLNVAWQSFLLNEDG